MPTATKPRAQIGMEDQFLEDPELEALLEERETLKEERKVAVEAVKEKTGAIHERLGAYDLPVGQERRCGGFIIARRHVTGRSVSFDVDAGVRTTIRKVKEKS